MGECSERTKCRPLSIDGYATGWNYQN